MSKTINVKEMLDNLQTFGIECLIKDDICAMSAYHVAQDSVAVINMLNDRLERLISIVRTLNCYRDGTRRHDEALVLFIALCAEVEV